MSDPMKIWDQLDQVAEERAAKLDSRALMSRVRRESPPHGTIHKKISDLFRLAPGLAGVLAAWLVLELPNQGALPLAAGGEDYQSPDQVERADLVGRSGLSGEKVSDSSALMPRAKPDPEFLAKEPGPAPGTQVRVKASPLKHLPEPKRGDFQGLSPQPIGKAQAPGPRIASSEAGPRVRDEENKPGHRVLQNLVDGQGGVLELQISGQGHYRVQVFSRKGLNIARLWDGPASLGQKIEWNGTDSQGRRAPSGVYIVTVEADGRINSFKTVVSW